jgi:hypothetical protein
MFKGTEGKESLLSRFKWERFEDLLAVIGWSSLVLLTAMFGYHAGKELLATLRGEKEARAKKEAEDRVD